MKTLDSGTVGSAVRERTVPFPVGLDLHIVAQNGAQIVEVALFVGHGDQSPVAVSGGILTPKIGAASSSACPDAGAVKATMRATAATATSKKAIRFRGTSF